MATEKVAPLGKKVAQKAKVVALKQARNSGKNDEARARQNRAKSRKRGPQATGGFLVGRSRRDRPPG